MPVFLERFVLAVCAAALVAIMLANPMKFDWTQRTTLSLAILLLAYFAAHTVHKARNPTSPAAEPSSAQSGGPATAAVVTEEPESKPGKGKIQSHAGKSETSAPQTPAPGSKAEASLPPPIREDMVAYQVPTLRELIRQMGVSEMWLSNIFQRALDGLPMPSTVDYPAALRALEKNGEVKILETVPQSYRDFWGEVFTENIRFRVKTLSPRVAPRLRAAPS